MGKPVIEPFPIEHLSWLLNLSDTQRRAIRAAIGEFARIAEGSVFDDDETKLLPGSTVPLLIFSLWLARVTRPIWQLPTDPMRGGDRL